MNIKSVTVCTMYRNFTKFILKICEKRTGMEPETDLFKASIVGTGKSIDFYIFVLGGLLPLTGLSLHLLFELYCCCVLYLVTHCHCHLI